MFLLSILATLVKSVWIYDSFKPGDWWVDQNDNFLQAHGGTVQWIDNYDCFDTGNKTGCWIWYGEDKLDPLGVHCYISKDLYNWVDKGQSLIVHNVIPQKLNGLGNDIAVDVENLKELKRRSSLTVPEKDGATEEDIKIAKNFLRAYATKIDTFGNYLEYDEESLLKAFVYLYKGYVVLERPKMLYNAKYNNYVIIFHCDGPTDWDIMQWIKKGFGSFDGSCYSRAMLGFAVSESPFGPFKLVNAQRMHYVEGYYDWSKGMARDQTVFLDDDGKAYAIYSSEENRCMYVSRLDDTFTTWDVPQEKAKEGVDFKARILDEWSREAPAIFKYDNHYYLMTSGTSGWAPNEAIYHRSKSLFGPWENMGNPCMGDKSWTTFDSQSAFIIVYNQSKGQFIYFGDQWRDWQLPYSRYLWIPVELNNPDHRFGLRYYDEWKLKDFFGSDDKITTKTNSSSSSSSNKNEEIQLNIVNNNAQNNVNDAVDEENANKLSNNKSHKTLIIVGVVVGVAIVVSLLTIIAVVRRRTNDDQQEVYEEI